MEEKITFGKFIAKKRKEQNMTQKELAERLFVTESAVSKWERGISYPDISLIADLCETLGVTEHELITASEDLRQKEIEKQAYKFQRLLKTYSWVFYILYGVSLAVCLICNLAIDHTLSWFFIVLTAELTAFCLTSLPLLLKKNKGLLTSLAFFVSLLLLLMVCCIYTGGDWFFVTFLALVFSYAVVFLPFFLRSIPLPKPLASQKTLLCFAADTVLLLALIAVAMQYSGVLYKFLPTALPTAFFLVLPVWLCMLAVCYLKINGFFRAGICFAVTGVFIFLVNSVLTVLLDNKPFQLQQVDFNNWSEVYLNGNITAITAMAILAMAVVFTVGGIILEVRNRKYS